MRRIPSPVAKLQSTEVLADSNNINDALEQVRRANDSALFHFKRLYAYLRLRLASERRPAEVS